jgi:hypothetical protein
MYAHPFIRVAAIRLLPVFFVRRGQLHNFLLIALSALPAPPFLVAESHDY